MAYLEDEVIERSPHDQEHPYTMVSNALIRDKTISPECRWLLIFLLSNAGKWKIEIKNIIQHVSDFMGRDKVYKLFDVAIEAGYLMREEWLDQGRKRYKYFLSEHKRFQKKIQFPENQYTEIQYTENQDTLRKNSLKKELKEEETSSSSLPPSDPKEEMRMRMTSLFTFTEKEFEEAWQKYVRLDPQKVSHPIAWFETVIMNSRKVIIDDVVAPKIDHEGIQERRKQAEAYERRFPKTANAFSYINACDEYVEIVFEGRRKEVRYDINCFQWQEETGWR